jgi:hypothetical protein
MQGKRRYNYQKGQGSFPEVAKYDKPNPSTRPLRKEYGHQAGAMDLKEAMELDDGETALPVPSQTSFQPLNQSSTPTSQLSFQSNLSNNIVTRKAQ